MLFSKQVALISLLSLLFMTSSGCNDSNGWQEAFTERLVISVTDSIGVEMGDSCYVLGAIADAEVSPSGNILILDWSAGCIRQYESDGVFLSNISRRGNGPGELSSPSELTVMPNGTILALDMGKAAIVVLSSDGESVCELDDYGVTVPISLSSLTENCFAAWILQFDIIDSEPLVAIQPSVFSARDGRLQVTLRSDTLIDLDLDAVISSASGLMGSTLVTSDGEDHIFYCLKSCSIYEILCWNTEGSLLFSASLPLSRVEKTPMELADETEYTRMRLGNVLPEGYAPDPYHTLVENIGVDSDGNLWVQRGTETNPVFDVFDSLGDHVATAEFPHAGRFWKFSITPYGAVAWNNDPLSGIQKLYMIDLPDISI